MSNEQKFPLNGLTVGTQTPSDKAPNVRLMSQKWVPFECAHPLRFPFKLSSRRSALWTISYRIHEARKGNDEERKVVCNPDPSKTFQMPPVRPCISKTFGKTVMPHCTACRAYLCANGFFHSVFYCSLHRSIWLSSSFELLSRVPDCWLCEKICFFRREITFFLAHYGNFFGAPHKRR